jgi:PilZ domain-containing protein
MYTVERGRVLLENMCSGHHFDLRNALRFPLHLSVTLTTATKEYRATTIDTSAGGILFHTESAIQIDSPVQFTIEMPARDLGAESPVLVKCQGRVVRCSEDASGWNVALVIDEYEFQRL